MGIERVILSLKEQEIVPPALPVPRVQISPLGDQARVPALKLVRDLRAAGIGALLAFGSRSLKSQLKSADRANVVFTLILGEQELASGVVSARNMASGEQTPVVISEIVRWLRERL
jgi:histidyl-tRNA synthetase